MPTQKYFDQVLLYVNLNQHAKNQTISLICSGGIVDFPETPALLQSTSYEFLATCQNLWKTKDRIPRKCPERQKAGRMEGQTDPILYNLFHYCQGPKKALKMK